MNREEIIAEAQKVAQSGAPFIFATVDESGCPQARWMGGLVLNEPFTVCMMSFVGARKMGQIGHCPAGQLVFNTPDFARAITVSGTCEVCDEAACKQKLWAALPMLSLVVSGPEDPNFGVVKFTGKRIELLAVQEFGPKPLVAEL
jgi:general stress protein 26